jgi:predicted nucleic acid-binding protein
VLCGKEQRGTLVTADYVQAIMDLEDFLRGIQPPPSGEAALIARAEAIRDGYGCSRSADAIYLALAEELARTQTAYLLTFDAGLTNQAARNASSVEVHLLT